MDAFVWALRRMLVLVLRWAGGEVALFRAFVRGASAARMFFFDVPAPPQDYLGVHDSPRYWHKYPVAQRARSVWRAHTHVPGRSATTNERMCPRWPHFFLSLLNTESNTVYASTQ